MQSACWHFFGRLGTTDLVNIFKMYTNLIKLLARGLIIHDPSNAIIIHDPLNLIRYIEYINNNSNLKFQALGHIIKFQKNFWARWPYYQVPDYLHASHRNYYIALFTLERALLCHITVSHKTSTSQNINIFFISNYKIFFTNKL